jgi:prephenate dehydrogenase
MIPQLPLWHSGSPLVMDIGSTKEEICEALSQLPARFHAIGGHPMCGKEFSSIRSAEKDLYRDAPFALCALPSTGEDDRQIAEVLVAAVGAKPIWVDARTHDLWVAATSHTPYLVANALAAVTPVEAKPLVGPGLRSTSRLAGSNLHMMMDILLTNREAVLNQLDLYQTQLNRLRELISLQSQDELLREISFGRDKYQEIITIKESK